MLPHRVGFDPTKTFVVQKVGFKHGREYDVGEPFVAPSDVGLRMLRQWFDYGWLAHPRDITDVVQNGAPLPGDGPDAPVHTEPQVAEETAPKVSKTGKVRIKDKVTGLIKWVLPEEVPNGV